MELFKLKLFLSKIVLGLSIATILINYGCKKEDVKNLYEAKPKEQWVYRFKDTIFYGQRNILASATDDSFLCYLTPESFYNLNSNTRNNSFSFNVPGYYYFFMDVKMDNRFYLFKSINNNLLNIQANVNCPFLGFKLNSAQSYVEGIFFRNDSNNQYVTFDYTVPNKNNVLYVDYMVEYSKKHYSGYVKLDKYQLTFTDRIHATLVSSKEIYYDSSNIRLSGIGMELNEVENNVFMSLGSTSLRIHNDFQVDTIPFQIYGRVIKNDKYYFCKRHWSAKYDPVTQIETEYPAGIMYSSDQGLNWYYLINSGLDLSGVIQSIKDKLFYAQNNKITMIDLTTNKITNLKTNGLNGLIKTIDFFRGKVYVGTDAGVYSKSWDAFINDVK